MTQKSAVERHEAPGVADPEGGKARRKKAAALLPLSQNHRPALQRRSADSEARILAAAEMLFARKGYRGTTIADIIAESGASTGSFYHRFSDKEGVARVMIDRFVERAGQIVDALDLSPARHPDLRSAMTALAATTYDTLSASIGTYRAAMRLGQTDPEILRHTATLVSRLRDHTLAHIDPWRAQIGAADVDLAITYFVQTLAMVTSQKLLGQGALFPNEKNALLDVLIDAGAGLLKLKDRQT